MKHTPHSSLITLLLVSVVLVPAVVFSQGKGIWEGTDCNTSQLGCGFCDAARVTVNIINFLVEIGLAVGVVALVYGGLMIAVSGASPAKLETGKKAITNAIVGIIIMLASWAIVNTVIHLLTGDPLYPWAEIKCEGTAPVARGN